MGDSLSIFNFDMRNFLIKGICFIVLFISLDIIGGRIFSYLHNCAFSHSPYGRTTEYAMEKVNTDVVIIGASTANHHYVSSLLADSLQMSVYNCGKDGCGFLYQCCIIDGILKRYTPKIIIWDIIPSYLSSPSSQQLDRLSDFNSYYDENDYCRNLINQRNPNEKYKMQSYLYRYNSRILALIYKSAVVYNFPADGYLPLSNTGYEYPSLIDEKTYDEFDERLKLHLNYIISECKQKEVKLILSLSPRFVNSDYLKTRVYEEWRKIAKERNIPLVDYYNNSFFLNDSTLCKDNAHLNDRGAHLFTSRWIEKNKQYRESYLDKIDSCSDGVALITE